MSKILVAFIVISSLVISDHCAAQEVDLSRTVRMFTEMMRDLAKVRDEHIQKMVCADPEIQRKLRESSQQLVELLDEEVAILQRRNVDRVLLDQIRSREWTARQTRDASEQKC